MRQVVYALEQIGAEARLRVLDASYTTREAGYARLRVATPDRAQHHLLAYLATAGEPRYVDLLAGALGPYRRQHKVPASSSEAVFIARYVGPAARRRCREQGLHYLSLADRSYLIALGHYHFEREASAAARPRRAREGDLLTPARLRVIRALLCHPTRAWDQIALAQKTRVSVGTVNALVNRLVDRKYGERRGGKEGKGPDQKFHLLQARELLDEWAEYWPRVTRLRHRYYARYGTVPQFAAELSRIAREIHDEEVSDHLTKRLWETPSTKSPEWRDALARGILENTAPFALTGLAAASFVEDFVRFTMIEAYATVDLDRLAQRAGLRAVEDEPNVVLIEPPDYGLLTETTTVGDVPIVCLAQLYVDLIAAGGRAAGEAAPLIRSIALGGPR